MTPQQIERSLAAGYTIRIVASTGAFRSAPAGATFRCVRSFEAHLDRARRERRAVGAELHWCLHSDDRTVTYEGKLVLDGKAVDICASMTRYGAAILARQHLFGPEVLARARGIQLAAAALAIRRRLASAIYKHDGQRVFELATAMMHTALSPRTGLVGGLYTVCGQA